jgi:hypothetical protein
LQQGSVLKRSLLVDGEEPPALVKIGGRLKRVEGVEIIAVNLLRKDGETDGKAVRRVEVVINARERIEALQSNIPLRRRETLHFGSGEAIFKALEEEELVLDDWAADRHARSRRADAIDFAVAQARAGQDIG